MNKLAIIPIFFLTMCGTAPVTDPPAHACSPRLDGKPTYCPEPPVCQALECDKRDLNIFKKRRTKRRDRYDKSTSLAEFTDDVSKKCK